jgi:hypothetical protein
MMPRRQHQCHRQDLTEEQAVGIDGGGKADSVGQPGTNSGRQGDLHDRHTRTHDHGHSIEPHDVGQGTAQRAASRIDHEPNDQRGADTKACNQQGTRHCREGKQH